MNKFVPFMLFFFFTSGLFITAFNPASAAELVQDSWNTKTPMSVARANLGVVAVDGQIYAIGGSTGIPGFMFFTEQHVDVTERYDPVSDTWVILRVMPTPRSNFAIATYQGKIYCIGGRYSDEWGKDIISGANEVYDIATNSWSTKNPLPITGNSLQAHVVNGKMYVLNSTIMYMYDPIADSWTQKTSANRSWFSSVVVDSKILATNDAEYASENPGWRGLLSYDPITDVWSEKASTGASTVAAGVTTGTYAPKKIYFISRYGTNKVYDPASNTWSTGERMDKPGATLTGFGVAVVDDILYVIGGHNGYDSSGYPGERTAANRQYVPLEHSGASPERPPVVTILSPSNPTYYNSTVDLTFTVNKAVVKMYGCLDSKENVTINGNMTLSRLSTGVHNVTVYAEDKQGNIGVSQTVAFTMASPDNPDPSNPSNSYGPSNSYNPSNPFKPFDIASSLLYLIAAAVALTVVVVVVGLFFYISKEEKGAVEEDIKWRWNVKPSFNFLRVFIQVCA
ncbi:MAG: hypothetical protein LBC12_07570 [Nitrososphaerota archaeon]|nr:hypothetical protein [Nitrososphaerota archaeon]